MDFYAPWAITILINDCRLSETNEKKHLFFFLFSSSKLTRISINLKIPPL